MRGELVGFEISGCEGRASRGDCESAGVFAVRLFDDADTSNEEGREARTGQAPGKTVGLSNGWSGVTGFKVQCRRAAHDDDEAQSDLGHGSSGTVNSPKVYFRLHFQKRLPSLFTLHLGSPSSSHQGLPFIQSGWCVVQPAGVACCLHIGHGCVRLDVF